MSDGQLDETPVVRRRRPARCACPPRRRGWPASRPSVPSYVELTAPGGVVEARPSGREILVRSSPAASASSLGKSYVPSQNEVKGMCECMRRGLGHDVHRVGVVEDPRPRRDPFEVRQDALEHVDRAQRHEEPARALGLLADDPVLERDALVEHAGLEAAGPVARQDRIDVGQARRAGRSWSGSAGRGPRAAGHPLGQPLDDRQPVGHEVDEHDLRAREARAVVVDERRHGAGARGSSHRPDRRA